MATVSLSIFSVTNRTRHLLKQSADINRVLNEFKKTLKTSLKNTYRSNKLITEKRL